MFQHLDEKKEDDSVNECTRYTLSVLHVLLFELINCILFKCSMNSLR